MKKLVLITLAAAFGLYASAPDDEEPCSVATLHGNYGFFVSGTRPSSPGGPIEQILGVAMTFFNGAGGFTQTDNVHGSISGYPAPDRHGSGYYTVNADCTGTMTLSNTGAPTLSLRIVIMEHGKEVRAVVVAPPPVLVTSVGKHT